MQEEKNSKTFVLSSEGGVVGSERYVGTSAMVTLVPTGSPAYLAPSTQCSVIGPARTGEVPSGIAEANDKKGAERTVRSTGRLSDHISNE